MLSQTPSSDSLVYILTQIRFAFGQSQNKIECITEKLIPVLWIVSAEG
jgi:hypothetical protein